MSKKKKNKAQKGQQPVASNQRLNFRWAYIFLFSFAIILYANTLNHDFAFDDSVVITGNKYTLQGIDGIKTLATKDLFYGIYGNSLDLEGGRWRPLTLIMFAVEYSIFGDNATPYHLINILLYGITAIVLFMTLLQVLSPSGGGKGGGLLAFLTTLLFIAHPLHTEVVANIKSRDEIMTFLFLCLTLYFLFRFVKTEKKTFVLYGAVCYFTALLSKENGITFVAVIPLALFCFAGRNFRQSILLTLPFFITAGIYLAIRTSLVGMIGDREANDVTDNPFLQLNFPALPTPLPFMEKFATVCWIVLKYLLLLIFPHPLTSDYGFNQIPATSLADPKVIASLLIYGGLFVYAVKTIVQSLKSKVERSDNFKLQTSNFKLILAFSILYFLFTISIVSNLFFLIGTNMGERFAYISSLGFCLALAAAILRITNFSNLPAGQAGYELRMDIYKNSKLAIPLLLIIIPYSYKTITRNPAWKDNKTLFTTDVKTSTGSANAHYYYANTLFTEHINDVQSAERDSFFLGAKKEFRAAMSINPYFHYCYYNIGLIWEKLGNPDSAIYYHERTLSLQPENTMAQYMAKGALGLVYGKLKGDADKAMPLLKEAIAWKPEDPGYHENLGICYAMKGDFEGSIREFELGLKYKTRITKEDARVYMNMGISWQNMGNKQKADENFQKAFELDPSLRK